MGQRIKGLETEILLIVDGKTQDTITDVRSFELAAKVETKEEGYLGEKTNRFDDIFNGVRGRAEFHFENGDVFNLMKSIIDRAKRRTPGTQINIKSTLNFPSGEKKRVLVQDAYFGEIPIGVPGRGDYLTFALDFQASDVTIM
jgi:hypothetical protein